MCSSHDSWYLDSTLTKLYIDTCCTQILGWFAGILHWTMQGSTIRTSVQISWQMPGESQHKPSRKWLLSAYRLRTEDIGVLVLRSTVSKSVSVGSLSFTSTLQSSCPLLQANFREPCSHCHCCLLSRSLAAQKIQRTEEKALCSHQDPGVY